MSSQITIYHNPRCSKSRDTLKLLTDRGIDPDVVLYLETPPDANTVKTLLRMLGMNSVRELLRSSETVYQTLNLADMSLSEDALVQAAVDNPILIERPIVIANARARIGRPPERVLEIID